MKQIVKMTFGSFVYGTNIPSSDQDFKGIFVPDGKDLILQRAPSTQSFNSNTKKNTKNTKDDIDIEFFSLQKFFHLLTQGQTVAFDVLFTPQQFWQDSSAEWQYIQNYKERLLHKKIGAFVGYCKAQSERYSLRGSRMIALEQTIEHLSRFNPRDYLKEAMEGMPRSIHTLIVEQDAPHLPEGKLKFLDVCGKKAGYTSSVKFALDIYQKTLHEYGERAKQAAENKGIDLKAQYHAVRIAREAEELLTEGFITFPRPEAKLLLDIRNGALKPEYVSSVIEEGMVRIEEAQVKSKLPLDPDTKFMEELLIACYGESVQEFLKPCKTNMISSRMCELGTKSCVVVHKNEGCGW